MSSKAFETLPKFITNYMAAEIPLVRRYAKGSVVDIGAGTGRAISMLDPNKVVRYHGIEPNQDYVNSLFDQAYAFSQNGIKVSLSPHTLEETIIPEGVAPFNSCLVLWNTLSMWDDPSTDLTNPLSVKTKSVLLTVIAKGNLNERLNYYTEQNIPITSIDCKTENIVSDQWETNRAYSVEDVEEILGDNWNITETGPVTHYCHFIIAESKKKFD